MPGEETEEIERLKQQLVDVEQAHDDFLAHLSHELRTPLHAVVGWAEMLLADDGALGETRKLRGLQVILRNAKLQTRLIDEMLDVARIVRGRLHLARVPLLLDGVIETAIDSMAGSAKEKEIELRAVLATTGDAVLADSERLQQVVCNLLSNAVKFSPSSSVVFVRTYCEGGSVFIEVEDSGPGIEPELLPVVFERFRQGRAGGTVKAGLGLGLAIVKGLVELHEGEVSASNSSRGARLLVRLPLLLGDMGPGLRDSDLPPRSAQASAVLAGARVAIVDDEPEAVELLTTMLERAGVRVQAFTSPEALLATELRADALILDIGMDALNGLELIARLRDRGLHVPAIALTAHAMERDRAMALRAGFHRHVAKPVDSAELLEALARLLAASR